MARALRTSSSASRGSRGVGPEGGQVASGRVGRMVLQGVREVPSKGSRAVVEGLVMVSGVFEAAEEVSMCSRELSKGSRDVGPEGGVVVVGSRGALSKGNNRGNTGATGDTGSTGRACGSCVNGDAGDAGSTGCAVDTGSTGCAGENGDACCTGSGGSTGSAGPSRGNGSTGSAGPSRGNGSTGSALITASRNACRHASAPAAPVAA